MIRHTGAMLNRFGLRAMVFATLGIAVSALMAVHLLDQWGLQRELQPLARETETALIAGETGFDSATVVTVSREFLVVGAPRAKIAVYIKSSGPTDTANYSGVEYFLDRQQGEWEITESGMCSSEQCAVAARSAFGDTSS